jgi:phosphatidate cytidylyltransferase
MSAPEPVVAPSSARWADLGIRTASSLFLVPAILADVWLGGVWFEIFAIFLGVLIAHEWCLIAHGRSSGQFALHALAVIVAALLPAELGFMQTVVLLLLITALSVGLDLFRDRTRSLWTWVGPLYASLPILALVLLRRDGMLGWEAILWIFIIVWAADVCAYFAGRTFGGPKLSPRYSPKKTWSGLGGAIVGSALVSALFAIFVIKTSNPFPLALVAAAFAVFEQAGDIFESAFKRHFGVKDSGTLIPGHGGVIDRMDGLIAVAIVAGIFGFLRNPEVPAAGLLAW